MIAARAVLGVSVGVLVIAGLMRFYGALGKEAAPPPDDRQGFPADRLRGLIQLSPTNIRWSRRLFVVALCGLALGGLIALVAELG
jgi:hypothetical protein